MDTHYGSITPEWMKPNTAPVTDSELEVWEEWARSPEVCTTKTGNRFIRLLNTVRELREKNIDA